MSSCSLLPRTFPLYILLSNQESFLHGSIPVLTLPLAAIAVVLVFGWLRRRATYLRLVRSGLPTVYWRPKFLRYEVDQNDKKLSSSTITNILPRMRSLKGPYDMYGTVYGLSTAVVHVAHPTPALAILSSSTTATNTTSANCRTSKSMRSSWLESTGVAKAPAYNHFQNFCGQGVFTADGQDWKDKRAAVLHALLRTSPGGWEPHLEQHVDHVARKLLERLSQSVTEGGGASEPLDIVPVLQRSTIGLIYKYITHSELDTMKTVDHKTKITGSESLLSSYLQSVVRIRLIILAQSRSFWFLMPRWFYRTFSSLFQKEEETMGPIRDFARLACNDAKPGSPLASLEKLPLYQSAVSDGVSDNLLYESITLLFAGQDTSAATLSWTLHLLSLYPSVQTELAQQVQKVMQQGEQDHGTGKFVLTRKHFAQMPLLDAVIKESMRLYPVAPFVVRKITSPLELPPDQKFSSQPVVLPAGSLACVWIYGLHRNGQFWKDPDAFVPERWLDGEQEKVAPPGSYMPFAHGPRNCVGQPLANIILRSLLAHLVNAFEFHYPDQVTDPKKLLKDMQVGFTVLPKGGVPLVLRKRGS